MTDDEFLRQFETCVFPLDQWHHRAHVKVAYLYVVRFGLDVAAQKLRDGIRTYNVANKIQDTPTGGYHETMTQAWLRIIHTTIQEYGARETADDFFDFHPQLSQKKNSASVLFRGSFYVAPSEAGICGTGFDSLAEKSCKTISMHSLISENQR